MRRVRIACLMALYACAQSVMAEVVMSWQHQNNELLINTDLAQYRVTQFNAYSFTIEQLDAEFDLGALALDPALEARSFTVADTDQATHAIGDHLSLEISHRPFAISVVKDNGLLATTTTTQSTYPEGRSAVTVIANPNWLAGGGARVLGMDRSGHKLPLYNKAHYGFETHSTQMYYSMPVVITQDNLAIIWDNPANGELDISSEQDGTVQFDAEYGAMRMHFIVADTPQALTQHFSDLTGNQPMPPRWALGMYASRFGYHSQAEVEATVNAFQTQSFPLDAVVLDLYWFGDTIKGTMGNLDWHPENWPDPSAMINTLADSGISTILITEPFILTSSSQWENADNADALAVQSNGDAKTFDFYFGHTGLVDVFSDQGQRWFLDQYQRIKSYGVSGWWGDLGEPEVHPADSYHQIGDQNGPRFPANSVHNAYGHQWAKMLHEFLVEESPNVRPFIMMRSGYVGSQRYGMVPWSGDVNRSWGGLQSQVEISLQMGLQGMAYMHSDIGGFAGGDLFDPELYVRWFQYGVFQPVLRPHAQENIPSEPVFHDYRTREITRDYAKLRYQLFPYIYTLSYQNSTRGLPLMRPVYFFDDTPKQRENTQQYFFGNALLVNPIVHDGQRLLETELPTGTWFDFWSDTLYLGNEPIQYDTPIDRLPVWVRAGSFIPMNQQPIANLSEYTSERIALHYYHHSSVTHSDSEWYEDDGQDPHAIKNQTHTLNRLSASFEGKSLSLTIDPLGNGFDTLPSSRALSWVVHGIDQPPKSVQVNGLSADYEYHTETRQLTIHTDQPTLQSMLLVIKLED